MDGLEARARDGEFDGRYGTVPYFSLPHAASDPDRAAVVAWLHGLDPADIDSARILELGCGDGGNLLTLAAARPEATLRGFDAEPAAIQRGSELAAEAGLKNVEFSAADVRALSAEDVGPADYVIVHGLWSWAPMDVREAALALAAEVLAEDGLVIMSYNALPGWAQWLPAQAIARRTTAADDDAVHAKEVAITSVREVATLHRADDLYAQMLRAAVERYENLDPWMLFHDDLNPHCSPFLVSDVVARAEHHGLRYVGEAMPSAWWTWFLPTKVVERLREDGASPASRQQLADVVSGIDFKSSVFALGSATPKPEMDVRAMLELELGRLPHASAPDGPDVARALFGALDPSTTGALSVLLQDAADAAGLEAKAAVGAALRLVADGRAALRCYPAEAAGVPGDRPCTAGLVRAQARRSDTVSSLHHERMQLPQPLVRALMTLLDGSRDRDALARDLVDAGPEWEFEADLDTVAKNLDDLLGRVAAQGLLVA